MLGNLRTIEDVAVVGLGGHLALVFVNNQRGADVGIGSACEKEREEVREKNNASGNDTEAAFSKLTFNRLLRSFELLRDCGKDAVAVIFLILVMLV